MNTYLAAKKVYETTRKRKLQNNTYLTKTARGYGIRLHDTVVVEYLPDRTILDSGGWKSRTTKDRINQYGMSGRWSMITRKGVWLISIDNGGVAVVNLTFADGCYYKGGQWHNTGPDAKEITRKRRAVRDYVDAFVDKLINREIPKPSAGDCWYCAMATDDGQTLGETTKNADHIENHIAEKYYVPSLLARVCEVGDISTITRKTVGYWLGYYTSCYMYYEEIAKKQIARAMRRYIYRELGL